MPVVVAFVHFSYVNHHPKVSFLIDTDFQLWYAKRNEAKGGITHGLQGFPARHGHRRERNPSRKIIIGGTHWNDVRQLCALRVSDDPNVIYTFHFYEPFEFTHQQGVLQEPTCFYNRKMRYPGDIEPYRDYMKTVFGTEAYGEYDRMDIRFIRDSLRGAVEFIREHKDKILYCGEFGVIRHCAPDCRESWFSDVISVLNENGIPYSVWNYLSTPNDGNRFSLVDDDSRQILSENLLRIIRG